MRFLFQKFGTDSVNDADSGDTKIFVRFPWNTILKLLLNFCRSQDSPSTTIYLGMTLVI